MDPTIDGKPIWKIEGPMLRWSGPILIRRRGGFDLEVVCLWHFFANPWGELKKAESMASTAAYLARRAAQKERVRILYRRALKDTLNWAVHRHLFYDDVPFILFPFPLFNLYFFPNSLFLLFQASNLRERFEENRHVVRFPLFTSLPFQIIASLTWFRSTHPLSYFVP